MRRPQNLFTRKSLALAAVASTAIAVPFAVQALVKPGANIPVARDVRGAATLPMGPVLKSLTKAQRKSLKALQLKVGAPLTVQYNGLTATPRHLFRQGGTLTRPSSDSPELIARRFLSDNAGLYRFSAEDLDGLRLRTRSTVPGMQSTVMVFEQQVAGLPVYQGDVLVNVSRAGEVISVGNNNFPQLVITNQRTLGAAQAVRAAAAGLGTYGYSPTPVGQRPVLSTYGELRPKYIQAESFAADRQFGDEIHVVPVVFPMGETARHAWKLNLTDMKHQGFMWQTVIDAGTGEVLSRRSLTHSQKGGGVGKGRRATFRPDLQDFVESFAASPNGAQGKVFDAQPTQMSGGGGFGKSTRTGDAPGDYVYTQPAYAAATVTAAASGRGFRYVQLNGRNQAGLPFGDNNEAGATLEEFSHAQLPGKLGEIVRGLPDATRPSAASPFGWFYLPTDTNGAEITVASSDHARTRAFGYDMTAEAMVRNAVFGGNAPGADGSQPYSATLSTLPGPVTLADGRTMSSVWQSNYTEGNNILATDDRADDNEATHGIRGYSATRQFTSPFFSYTASYEYGGTDAGGDVFFPPSTDPDVPPAVVNLFNINNLIHDYLHEIGFTEPMWNFQQDNFGRGGAGGDAVSVQVMDGGGVNNANFGTPAEGGRPRMQMYLFTEASQRRSDGSFDFDIVAHEFYHGVSNRSAAKGGDGCLGGLVTPAAYFGEPIGQGEGWGDFFANSLTDDDAEGEYATGELDVGIRVLPVNNYRWSYASVNGVAKRRDSATNPAGNAPDGNPEIPFEGHQIGEFFTPILWDMRELLIMKEPGGVFYDGMRRLGSGTGYYIGDRLVQSVDANHPIDYRASFGTTATGNPTVTPPGGVPPISSPVPPPVGLVSPRIDGSHFQRPGMVAAEIAQRGNRNGPMASAVSKGARMADTLVLRGLQVGLCDPSFIDTRDAILMADQQMNGGENRALIWRAFASHGVGESAATTSRADVDQSQGTPTIVEAFDVPAAVEACEANGPLPSPGVSIVNTVDNTATLTITPSTGTTATSKLLISRATSAAGPYVLVTTIAAPATGTATYADNDGGSGLPAGLTYYYRARESRDANGDCMSQSKDADITPILIGKGVPVTPNPFFLGVTGVDDPQLCDTLNVSWSPAYSAAPMAKLVYDVYRVTSPASDGVVPPSFIPRPENRVQEGLPGTSFIDKGLTRNQPYYYIVRARDSETGRIDSGNAGNTVVKYAAPGSPTVATGTAPFAVETFESASGSARFVPALVETGTPNQTLLAWQRVTNHDFGGEVKSSAMFAPDFDSAQSDISTVVGPIAITGDSVLHFDSKIFSEAGFDGGLLELSYTPAFLPMPDNETTFDLGDYMIQGGYNGKISNTALTTGRRAFTGSRGLTHTRVTLKPFASGGAHASPTGRVFIRFRATSDDNTNAGPGSGWFVDNLAVTNLADCPANAIPLAVLKATPQSGTAPLTTLLSGAGSSDPDTTDNIVSYTFDFGDGSEPVTQTRSEVQHSYLAAGSYTATLTVTDNKGATSEMEAAAKQTITVGAPPSSSGGTSSGGPNPPVTPPKPGAPESAGGRFGGGAPGLPLLAGLALLGLWRRRARH